MLEMKITITAPDLAEAINNLAAAISGNQIAVNPPQPAAVPMPSATAASAATAPGFAGPSATSLPSNQPNPVPVASSIPQPQNAQAPVPPPQQTVPTPAPVQAAPNVPLAPPPQYTVDQIMAAGATLMDNGKGNELQNLLHSFGVQAVLDLKPDQLGPFATAMRELGAKI